MKPPRTIDRRTFTRSLALSPLAMASHSALSELVIADASQQGSQTPALAPGASTPQRRVPKTAAEYNKHPPIHETDPFADALTFTRAPAIPRATPFALDEVILNEGPLKDVRDWNRAYMMRLANDRLLHNFRVTAGLPSSARPLGGWEAPTAELRGHFVGHYLSAAALLYASTNDQAMKVKADGLVEGIAECQAQLNADGFVAAFPPELFDRLDRREKVWAPFYTLHKIMAGLLDMYVQTHNGQALDVDLKLAAWVDRWTADKTEGHMQDILRTEFGGMSEVLYNLAAVTGEDRWAITGDRFTKKVFVTPLAQRRDELKGLHCNTHMPQVVGAARRYELSSDARFKNVASFFFETVSQSRTYASGGSGNTESWLTDANHLALEMQASSHHQECCCSYNMMKLSRHLYSWSADPRIIDYYERNLLNHRLGAIEPTTGLSTYFLSMSPGAWKTTCTNDETFWCCTGSALEDYAKIHDTVYYHDENDLFVNLYVASQVHWQRRGVRLRQVTRFPFSEQTTLHLDATPGGVWRIHLRIPDWTTSANSIQINGRTLEVAGVPGSYLSLTREWKAGDRIDLTLPMRVTAEPLTDDPTQVAFLYGPLVLAGHFPRGTIDFDLQHNQGPEIHELPPFHAPTLSATALDPGDWIKPVPHQPLTFRTTGQPENITLKPLNQSWDRFSVYFTVA